MNAIRTLSHLFWKHGSVDYTIGSNVSHEQHMVQACLWAKKEGFSKQIQLAALLHDVGHLVAIDRDLPQIEISGVSYGTDEPHKVGANFLRGLGIEEDVCKMVEGSVNNKNYLITSIPDYYKWMTSTSKNKFPYQSGRLVSSWERKGFSIDPLKEAYIILQELETYSKNPNLKTDPADAYLRLLIPTS